MSSKEFTVDEHIVSQFLLKNFSNEKDLICFVNIKSLKSNESKSTVFMFEKDMYEFKTLSGEYFRRNFLENRFAEMEGYISKNLIYEDFNRQMTSDEIAVAHLLWALLLVKSKELKDLSLKIISEKSTGDKSLDKILSQSLYLSILDKTETSIEFLEKSNIVVDKSKFSKNEEDLLSYLLNYSFNNLIVYIVKADGNSEFIISDSPVVKNQFGDAKYIVPYSPKYAICFYPLTKDNLEKLNTSYLTGVPKISKYIVDKINKYSCENARQFIACSLSKENYVKELLKEVRGGKVE